MLLTDVVMPEMLGKEVAERLTALRPGISRAVHVRLRPAGGRAQRGEIIDKPFTEAALLARLRALLASPASP